MKHQEIDSSYNLLLFPEKEAKSVVPLRGKLFLTQTSAKPTLGVWGLAPKKESNISLLFPEKEAKSVCSASQKIASYPNLGEADPGGSGGHAPQKTPRRLNPKLG
jgi:hypothetical protein